MGRAVRRPVVKRAWQDGVPFDLLDCGHFVPTEWDVMRKKRDESLYRDCAKCDEGGGGQA